MCSTIVNVVPAYAQCIGVHLEPVHSRYVLPWVWWDFELRPTEKQKVRQRRSPECPVASSHVPWGEEEIAASWTEHLKNESVESKMEY